MIDIAIEEIVIQLKEEDISNDEILRHCQEQGYQISEEEIRQIALQYYIAKIEGRVGNKEEPVSPSSTIKMQSNPNKEKDTVTSNTNNKIEEIVNDKSKQTNNFSTKRIADIKLREILMTGQSIKGYCLKHECQEDEDKIKEKMKRLKSIAEHSRKGGEQWIPDTNFLEIIKVLESIGNIYPANKYMLYLRPYLSNGICKNGNISLIQMNVFKDNKDLMTFILSGCHIRYGEEYDIKVWNKRKAEYEAKIDKYFNRLYALEERARNKLKESKSSKLKTKKNGINPQNPGDER